MFTGIIEETGKIIAIQRGTKSAVISIKAVKIIEDLKIGDSVAVNGVCLTVTTIRNQVFLVDVMNETIKHSTFATLFVGNKVNLERAMSADGRFGGHIVTGHVDGTGSITKIESEDNATWYTIKVSEKVMRYIVEKGSVAVDGISLTVASLSSEKFRISVIPHTRKMTILSEKRVGDSVNIENDLIGKYIEKLIHTHGRINQTFLEEYGF